MPKERAKIVAVRPKIKNNAEGKFFELSYISTRDPHGFPSIAGLAPELFDTLDGLRGEVVELSYIETPPYGNVYVTDANPVSA